MMNGNKPDFYVAVASDLHLGNVRNTASEIIVNLRAAFPDNVETAKLHMICIAGDAFDKLLSLSNEAVHDIDLYFAYMLRLCKKHDIMFRILDGTKSHDWYQSQRVETLNEIMGIGCDLKYVRELSIEYIPKFDINILYVPDEWNTTTERTLSQVKDLLRAKGLDQVDYAMMHGQFEYQLPAHIEAQKHSSSEYLKIVRELIFIGHVHKHSRYDRIIAQGSFDRLTHGEEEAKGHVRAYCRPNGEHDIVFVETKNAKRFVTVNCVGLDAAETLVKIDESVKDLPDNSHVRIEADTDNPVLGNMEAIVRNYSRFVWKTLGRELKEEKPEEMEDENGGIIVGTFTCDNLGQLIVERLVAKGATSDMLHFIDLVLTEVL